MKISGLSLHNAVAIKVAANAMGTDGIHAADIQFVDDDHKIYVGMQRNEMIDLLKLLTAALNEQDAINGKHVFELSEKQRHGTDGVLRPYSFYV